LPPKKTVQPGTTYSKKGKQNIKSTKLDARDLLDQLTVVGLL